MFSGNMYNDISVIYLTTVIQTEWTQENPATYFKNNKIYISKTIPVGSM